MLTRLLFAPSVALCLVATATGCGGRAAIVGGALAATAGTMLVYSIDDSSHCTEGDESCMFVDSITREPINAGIEGIGITAIVLGGVLMVAGMAKVGTESPEPAPTMPIMSSPTVVAGPPGMTSAPVAMDVAVPAAPHLATPAERAIRARPENQLALQISAIARAGHCDAARRTGERLFAIDPGLYQTLAQTDVAFADCLASTPATAP